MSKEIEERGRSVVGVEWCRVKFHAVRTLARMMIWLTNWREVWSSYRTRLPLPTFQFRRRLTLNHGPDDDPVLLLNEVFAEGCYRRYIRLPGIGLMTDIGANIGAVTLDWACRSPRLRIHAYEPNPATNETLRRNVEANGLVERITVYREAVGRGPGEFKLWTNVPSVLATGYGEFSPAPGGIPVAVPMIDLNEVIRRAGGESVSLLKIDTEGAEADILEGATPSTLMAIKNLIIEYHDHLCPDALSRCRQVLDRGDFRYRIHSISESQGLIYGWRDWI